VRLRSLLPSAGITRFRFQGSGHRPSQPSPFAGAAPLAAAGTLHDPPAPVAPDPRRRRSLPDGGSVRPLMPTAVRFILVHPRTPENLGAAARAMKNFDRASGAGFARRGTRTTHGLGRWRSAPRTCSPRPGSPRPSLGGGGRLQLGGGDVGTRGSGLRPWTPTRSPPRRRSERGGWRWCSATSAPGSDAMRSPAATPSPASPPTPGSPRSTWPRPSASTRTCSPGGQGARSRARCGQEPTPISGASRACSRTCFRAVRFVRPGRAGVGPLMAPWRRSGLTHGEVELWEGAFRMLARSLQDSQE